MTTRRTFLASLSAATIVGPIASAHHSQDYVVPEEHLPVEIRLQDNFEPGEIHLDPNSFRLYWTLEKRRAIRYIVGVGKPGLYQPGEFTVGRKREWPSWKPTPQMIKRNPGAYARFADGVPGGPKNPLGARALYLHNARGFDTALRIHGTPHPWTVGSAVSNGCARLVNDHIADLYNRVPKGTRVFLYKQNYS